MNKLDRKINAIVFDIDDCIARFLLAVKLSMGGSGDVAKTISLVNIQRNGLGSLGAGVDLRFEWVGEKLELLRDTLSGIDTERILITRRDGQSTKQLFEDKITTARDCVLRQTSGIFVCITQIFNDSTSYNKWSVPVLELFHEIRGKCKIILRRLKWLETPFLGFVGSIKPALIVLAIALATIPICYIYRAHTNTPQTPLLIKVNADTHQIQQQFADPGQSLFQRTSEVVGTLSELCSKLPPILMTLAVLLGLLHKIMNKQGWQRPSLKLFEKQLTSIANALK